MSADKCGAIKVHPAILVLGLATVVALETWNLHETHCLTVEVARIEEHLGMKPFFGVDKPASTNYTGIAVVKIEN